jgi:hypothetical protein
MQIGALLHSHQPTCVPLVQLALPLVARKHRLLCVDHDAHIPVVLIRGKDGLVLALQQHTQLRCQPADDLQQK